MGYYIFLFFIPTAMWILFAKLYFKHEFTFKEMAAQGAVSLFILAGLFAMGSYSQTYDTMLVNGVVTELNPEQQSCPMGWNDFTDNFCTEYTTRRVPNGQTCTTTNGRRSCTTNYKTQYNYIYPWERRYFVETDLNQTYEISRVDRQGVNTPPRFSEIVLGDPVTASVSYTNYIRGASDSLFNETLPDDELPPLAYPRVRDYYRVNRVIFSGTEASSQFHSEWNEQIAVINSNIRETGANVILVITGNDQNFAQRLAQAWEAHNINDVIVTIGVSGEMVSWVDVRSWSSNEMVNITIRDEILNLGTLDNERINAILETAITEYYDGRDMSEFEYLADDIPPPTWAIVLAFILLFVASPVATWFLSNNQIKS